MGLWVIYVASHVGSQTATLARMRDLTSYFFTALWIFVFFYSQYRLVPRFTKRRLADYLGYWQALIGFAMLLMGALYASPGTPGDVRAWCCSGSRWQVKVSSL